MIPTMLTWCFMGMTCFSIIDGYMRYRQNTLYYGCMEWEMFF